MGRKVLVAKRGRGRMEEGEGDKRKKQKSKGARWAKGHSCESNPKTTKFRDQVSTGFLQPQGPGKSLLTVKNLNTNRPDDEEGDDNDTILSSDVASLTISDSPLSILTAASSIRTIASGWSQVSHNAFERFLRKFSSDIVAHKEMLSILGAASEVIGEAGGKRNETEFFATFMSLLNTGNEDQYFPVMSLVCIIIGKVSPGVLKLRFNDIYPKIGDILSYAVENDDDRLIRTTIEAFTKLIKVQDSLNFDEDKVLEGIVYTILKCSLHGKPRVRRKVRITLKTVINAFNEKRCSNAFPKLAIGWVLDQLSCFPMCDSKLVADALTLLMSFWNCLKKISFAGAKKLFESVLRVMSSGDAAIMKIGLSFFVVVFQNDVSISESETDSENTLNVKLLIALWELQPDWRNIDVFINWVTCVLLGMIRANSKLARLYLPKLLEVVNPIWITNYAKRVLQVMKEYIPHLISQEIEFEVLDPSFQTIAKSYLIIPPNPNVLQITECILDQLSPQNYNPSAEQVFLQLVPLSQSTGVSQVLGMFVKAFGIEVLWGCLDQTSQWNILLPLLQDHLDNANITFWKKEIFLHIGKLGTPKSIWSSFIGFARNPRDPTNFPAELIGKVINDRPEYRLQALAALRQFIEWKQCTEVAVKYSKNYLPLLFNLYVLEKTTKTNPGHADAIGVTIQKYVTICEETLIHQLLEKAFEKLETEVEHVSALSDLVAFLCHNITDVQMQMKVAQLVQRRFSVGEERKRVYRIMTFLVTNANVGDEVLSAMHQQLSISKGETKSNAAALRLECINALCEKKSDWKKHFLPEIVTQLISANAKAKRCSSNFVIKYCSEMKEAGKSMDEMILPTIAALKSGSPLLVSSTTFFLFLVYKELKPECPNLEILNMCFENIEKLEDAVVWKYSLAFINLHLSLFQGKMGPFATKIGTILGDSRFPRREVNKIMARMIKVFGSAGLKAVVPNAEEPKMHTRIRNLCKKLKKLKEEKLKRSSTQDDVASDDEEEEDEFGQVKAETRPLVIKEGLVDFLNPREITQALANEVNPAKEDSKFKETKDGKLIIGNMGEDDEEDEVALDSDDSDTEMEVSRFSRKRKASGSVASASSKRSVRTNKTTFSKSSKNRIITSQGSRSVKDLGKRKKFSSRSSVKSSAPRVRF